MDEILDILYGYVPILFSGAIVGAIVSFLGPTIIKKLRDNFIHQKIYNSYNKYQKNPQVIEKSKPELAAFFKDESWLKCPCPNCKWLAKKVNKQSVEANPNKKVSDKAI